MSSPLQPQGDRGFDCLLSQQQAVGFTSLPCFGARFSDSSRQTTYLCNTFPRPQVAASDRWQLHVHPPLSAPALHPKGSHPNWVQSSERQQPAKDVSSWADIWCLLRFKVTLQLPGAGLYQQQQHELIKWISVIPGSQDAYKHQGPVQTTTQSWRFYLFD